MCEIGCQEMDGCGDEMCCDAEQETPEPVGQESIYTPERVIGSLKMSQGNTIQLKRAHCKD